MCYRIRQAQTEHQVSGTPLIPPGSDRLRPRLVGVAAAALVAGIAAAALVLPSPVQQAPRTEAQSAAPALPQAAEKSAPASATQEASPAASNLIERTSISGDDDVPTNADVARTVSGGCSHQL